MHGLKDRLKYARKNANITQLELANIIGISQGSISDLESGRNKTSVNITKFAEVLKVNPHWLATGQGEMTAVEFNHSNIDNTLLNQAITITNLDKDKTIETALQFFITMHAQKNIRALRGKLNWEGDLTQMRSSIE